MEEVRIGLTKWQEVYKQFILHYQHNMQPLFQPDSITDNPMLYCKDCKQFVLLFTISPQSLKESKRVRRDGSKHK